jgi:hypothetical protein
MLSTKSKSRGFTLIAAMLLLALMSAAAIGLFMMVNTEVAAGGHDVQNMLAYRQAEGGIEKMTSDLANLFQNIQNPSPATITGLSSKNPDPNTFVDYTFTPNVDAKGNPITNWTLVPSGTFQGLYAQTLDVQLLATAQTPTLDQVSMTRTVQLAMIPVFQFGAFSEPDLAFTNNPNYDFVGRVHTNGDLYMSVAAGNTLTFHDQLEAYGNVIREVWPNGIKSASAGNTGNVKIPTASGGCDGAQPACLTMNAGWGSEVSFPNPVQNTSPYFTTTSKTTYNGWIADGDNGNSTYGTGVRNLNLPFISGTDITNGNSTALQHQILDLPLAGEDPTTALGQSRLYNQAQIRVLLADDPSEFQSNPTNSDGQSIRLANVGPYQYGVPVSVPNMPALAAGHSYTEYFATASTGIPDPTTCSGGTCDNLKSSNWLPADWQYLPAYPPSVNQLTLTPNSGSVAAGSINAPVNNIGAGYTPTTQSANITSVTPPPCSTSTGLCTYPYYTPPDFPSYYYPTNPPSPEPNSTWNLLDGYLRVEALENGNWVGVTQEWLKLGFGRGALPPTTTGTNSINPNAILILQEAADRSGNGGAADYLGTNPSPYCTKSGSPAKYTCTKSGIPPEVAYDQITNCSATNVNCPYFGDNFYATQTSGNLKPGTPSITMFNWYPINFYDSREGEPWDVQVTPSTSCSANGVMNAVELDVGNLQQWLAGNIGTTGTQVSSAQTNGYILYFSDRRGMLKNAGGVKTGEYGFEDTINLANNGVPDGKFEPTPTGKTFSPEDVDEDNVLETYGATNVGLGFGVTGGKTINSQVNASATKLNPYIRFSCVAMARQNWVSGARHVLRLVDGKLGQVPTPGFTVGSENPVYIWGDYNSNDADSEWNTPPVDNNHSNAAVIGDTVTLLSDNWADWGQDAAGNPIGSFSKPQSSVWYSTANKAATAPTFGETAATTAYRVAIAAGKTVNFQNTGSNPNANFGIDGGVGNFLRLLEDWCSNSSGCKTQQTLHYAGSLVTLYYSEYATGTFKCCSTVYNPPVRDFNFDQDFAVPAGLPPGTPMFRDVDNLSYRQLFTQRTNSD